VKMATAPAKLQQWLDGSQS